MTSAIAIAHWIAGLIVLAEALNKVERCTPFARGLTAHERWVGGLKALAWAMLAIGSACALITPLMQLESPTFQDACVLCGFAVLIVRTRVKEG